MVKYSQDNLSQLFRALADPTRRSLVEELGRAGQPVAVAELARPYQISLTAVIKHLAYLDTVGLVKRTKLGRTTYVEPVKEAYQEINWWLAEQLHFWKDHKSNADS
ncbi:MAG TPA: metalloregulator ArsR/SmtB family transcription factor [Candidatus Nanoarchaeia archaeon]|nr:metalloregulator ArsR/SmtB family transcription factor [Candidatus Nanoarchaeia archaeon]